jgi:hypothetical protein
MLFLLLVLLGAPHFSRSVADPLGQMNRPGRGLKQQGSGPNFGFRTQAPSMFDLTPSEAITSLGSWINNLALFVECINPDGEPYIVGPANPEFCVEQIEVTMSSELFGNVTVVFDADQLSELRSVDPNEPTQYAWGLPLNKYAVPYAYYEGASVDVTFGEGSSMPRDGPGFIFNPFNASATSLREYYGVDPSLKGSNETVQGTALSFSVSITAVNTTAASEYLALQGLVPNVPLQISDWAPPNNLSVCGNCDETQMDVETLQAFAPQAVTFFVPTEKLTGPQIVPYVLEAARSAGYTEDQIQQLIAEFESEGPDSPGVKRTIAQLYSAITKAYFRDFVSNVTSSEPRVQVVSLSWNSDYTDEIGDFKFFEDGLRNLTLSGISVRV